MLGILVKYADFYGTEIPKNPIDLIIDIPKEELISTIDAINTRLKPMDFNYFDDSRETQIDCLRALFLDTKSSIENSVCLQIIKKYIHLPKNYNFFSRVTCLYALQEIINFDEFVEETPTYNFENRERIFKFLLISNEKILTGDKNYNKEGYDELGNDFFEFFMFRELHHNQYNECSNAINIFYKSFYLFNKIENDPFFGIHFKNYLTWNYNIESINKFLKHVIWTYIKSYDNIIGLRYINVKKDNIDAINILDVFSSKFEYEIPNKEDLKLFDFLPLKKRPLYKCKINEGKDIITYLVMDEGFYIEKAYSIFINDFWFDYLKLNGICTRKVWGKFIGTNYYEPFIEEILQESFSNSQNTVLRSSKQLMFNIGKGLIEYADFYLREKQNVALFEVKSGFIPIDHGYKTVKTIEDFKNLNLDKFNEDYGLTQLAEKTILEFHNYKKEINDSEFNLNRKVQLYPVIIVNDPIISSSIVTFVLKRKFNQLLLDKGINCNAKEHNIKGLSILNISHLQDMEQSLKDKKNNFFKILDLYLAMSDYKNKANLKNHNYLRTFDHVLNVKIKNDLIANRIKNVSNWLEE
jgi:hypothetical protein